MFPLLPVTFTLGSGLTFEHSLPCHWKEVPLALIGATPICLNSIFVNCDPAPSRGAANGGRRKSPEGSSGCRCLFLLSAFLSQGRPCDVLFTLPHFLLVRPHPLYLLTKLRRVAEGREGVVGLVCPSVEAGLMDVIIPGMSVALPGNGGGCLGGQGFFWVCISNPSCYWVLLYIGICV